MRAGVAGRLSCRARSRWRQPTRGRTRALNLPPCPRPTRFCRARCSSQLSRRPSAESSQSKHSPARSASSNACAARVEDAAAPRCAAAVAGGGPDAQVHAVPPERSREPGDGEGAAESSSLSPFANALSFGASAFVASARTRPVPRPCPLERVFPRAGARPRSTRSLPGLGGKSKLRNQPRRVEPRFADPRVDEAFVPVPHVGAAVVPRSDEARRVRGVRELRVQRGERRGGSRIRVESIGVIRHHAAQDGLPKSTRDRVVRPRSGALLRIAGGRRPSGVSGACGIERRVHVRGGHRGSGTATTHSTTRPGTREKLSGGRKA